jgi:hypothetical protein
VYPTEITISSIKKIKSCWDHYPKHYLGGVYASVKFKRVHPSPPPSPRLLRIFENMQQIPGGADKNM